MSRKRRSPLIAGLFVFLFFAVAGCSDDTNKQKETDAGFSGQLVPTGGVSMNEKFVLSGHLSSGTAETTSANKKFTLTTKQLLQPIQ